MGNKNVQTTPPEFVNIGEANYLKFIPRTDEAYFDACAAIEAEGSKTKRATLEKANGIKWLLGALLFDAEARQHLPQVYPTRMCLFQQWSGFVGMRSPHKAFGKLGNAKVRSSLRRPSSGMEEAV